MGIWVSRSHLSEWINIVSFVFVEVGDSIRGVSWKTWDIPLRQGLFFV